MKNVLLITSLYPSDDVNILNNTSVCHYFTKEWVKMGYNVRVIYSYRIYPWFLYPLIKLMGRYIARKQPTAVFDKCLNSVYNYEMDGVKITRIPLYKPRPHKEFREKDIKNHCGQIISIMKDESFAPDVILGHFVSPSLRIVTCLKEYYPEAKTAVSMHGKGFDIGYSQEEKDLLSKLDYIGYRSHSIRKAYENRYGQRKCLMCPSGVPEEYIVNTPRGFSEGIKRFIYVGSFMDRKHPSTVVEALSNAMGKKDYSLVFVGDGAGKKTIIKTATKCGNLDKIRFTGRLSREQVTMELDDSDVFIMVSENETFGLVYLEAMSRGCITIASIDEGMDGYIEDGQNGFLCKSGNSSELANVIKRLMNLPRAKLQLMSLAGLETARSMSDKKVAQEYISVFND